MVKIITQNDVIEFIYGEKSRSEQSEILEELNRSSVLYSFYKDTVGIKSKIEKSACTPSDVAIEAILNYSKDYEKKVISVKY